MASSPDTALSANSFVNSIGINVHMEYTDGAYANETNVATDLAYLGIKYIRDGLPTNTSSIPTQNQITSLNALAKLGIKFDLLTSDTNVQADIAAANAMEVSSPGAIFALEGPNEINNFPVTYNGLTGQAAAVAFQTAYYAAIKADSALSGVSVFNYTGGSPPIATPYGTLTQNSNGSFTLVNGITGWLAYLPVGITTITATYTGAAPLSGLFGWPGAAGQSGLTAGANGTLTYTYDNTGTAPLQTYISFSDWTSTTTLTSLSAVNGASSNLVAFDPDLSLAGMADDSNTHPYPSYGSQPDGSITYSAGLPVPGPSVITESGYETNPNDPSGVSQLVQAQGELKILLDGYKAGNSQTYLYELLDEKSDPSNTDTQMHFGVFNNNNTPKLAAVAIHDLTTILNANNTPENNFTPGTLAWSTTNLPATANTLLLQKTNGAFDLVLWDEPASTTSTGTTSVTVALGATYGSVEIFDPVTGSNPIETVTNVSQLTLNLGQDPLIVEVEPPGHVNVRAITWPSMQFLRPTPPPRIEPVVLPPAPFAAFDTQTLATLFAAHQPTQAAPQTVLPANGAAGHLLAAAAKSLTSHELIGIITGREVGLFH
jgi:hypothetical protein